MQTSCLDNYDIFFSSPSFVCLEMLLIEFRKKKREPPNLNLFPLSFPFRQIRVNSLFFFQDQTENMSAQTTLMGNASIDNNTPSHRQEQLQACDVQNMTEKQNGIRCSWNIFPASPRDAQKLVAPLGCIYTPKKPLLSPNNILLPYSPLSCSKCGAKLNPYCPLDVSESPSSKKTWMCVFCQHCNFFPPHYSTISSTQMPGEVFPCNTTVEYQPPQSSKTNLSPALIFVVDTCALRCELAAICSAISNVLEALPDDLLVGCITFGRTVVFLFFFLFFSFFFLILFS